MKNYGFIPEPIVANKDWVFGSSLSAGGEVLRPDGQWTELLPQGEKQFNYGFEPSACVSFGTLNAVEILIRHHYADIENFSDRFLAKMSGTTPQGNGPQTVGETLRKQGVPYEIQWPITPDLTTWDKFYSDIPKSVQILAQQFPAEYSFTHEFVNTSPAQLKEALKYSPLGIAVSAWQKNGDVYVSTFPNNHWCVLVGYKDGEHWIVYDSYDENGDFVKHLAWDFDFSMAKRYAVNVQVQKKSQGWINFLVQLVLSAFGIDAPKDTGETPQPEPPPQPPKYQWDTIDHIKHTVRVICDEEGFTLEQKNTMYATIWAESGFNLKAKNENKVNGKVVSTDYGICQWNDYYHGKEITPDEAVNNPEKAVRLMCQYWKRGQRNLWIAYKSGAYKKYL